MGKRDLGGDRVARVIERPVRKWSRSYRYGYARANDWPLWVAWLLAPSKASREIVRDLMRLKKAGVDV